jgi:DNA-binding response OmpR family regulator
MKILIVEDEALVADSLEFLLETEHHSVAVVADVAGARRYLEGERPDVALVDLRLANDSSGMEIAVELKSPGIPCIFMSAELPPAVSRDFAVGCLHKPFDADSLFAALNHAITARDFAPQGQEMIGSFEPFASLDSQPGE